MARKGEKSNPYTWQEVVARKAEGKFLPVGTWVKMEDGSLKMISDSIILVTDGSKTTGHMGGKRIDRQFCDDGKDRPKLSWRNIKSEQSDDMVQGADGNIRTTSPELGRKYGKDMSTKNWLENPGDNVVEDTASHVINGSHRMFGLSLSRVDDLWFPCAEGVDPDMAELMAKFDRGRTRQQHLNLMYLFKECPSEEDAKTWIRVSTQFLRGPMIKTGKGRTDAEREAHIREDIKSYVWLAQAMGSVSVEIDDMRAEGQDSVAARTARALLHPSVLVAFLRAHIYYRENKDKDALARLDKMFPGYIREHLTAKQDTAAAVLAKRVTANKFPDGAKDPDRTLRYDYTGRAILKFVSKTEIDKSDLTPERSKQRERFPLQREAPDKPPTAD